MIHNTSRTVQARRLVVALVVGMAMIGMIAPGAVAAEPPKPGHYVHGEVTDDTDDPLEGIEVIAVADGEILESTTTDEDGIYELVVDDLEDGEEFTVELEATDHEEAVTYETAAGTEIDFEDAVVVESIDLNVDDTSLEFNETTQADVTATYDDDSDELVTERAAFDYNDTVLTVYDNGTVEAHDVEDTVTLTADYMGYKDSIEIEVAEEGDDDTDTGGGGGIGAPADDDDVDVDEPAAVIDIHPDPAAVGEEVTFDGGDSHVEDAEVSDYEWTIDGQTLDGEKVTKSFDEPGEVDVELEVTTDRFQTDTATETLTVDAEDDPVDEPTAVIDVDPDPAEVSEEVTFSAADSSVEEGEIVDTEWTIDGETYEDETVTEAFDEVGEIDVELTVTTDAGETDTATDTLTIEGDDDDDDGPLTIPGFGVGVSLVALLAVALLAARRQH